MKAIRALLMRLSGLIGKERKDRALADEIDSILQMHIENNLRAGMSLPEARRQALIQFGAIEAVKESYRDRRGVPVLDTLAQDLRYSLRALRRAPGITSIAILTVALGIGATTAIFSVVYSVLLKPLPFPEPQRLVQLWEARRERGWDRASFTLANFWDVRARNQTFEEIGAAGLGSANLTGSGEPRPLSLGSVSAGFFELLGVKPILGRGFLNGDDQPGHDNRIALLENKFWRTQFGADPQIIGQTLRLDGRLP